MIESRRIAIVGAGCSGTLCAVRLVRAINAAALGKDIRVVLFDGADFGPDLAYGTRCPLHLLNVPAGRMSGSVDDPEDFLRWRQRERPETTGGDFVPRTDYGRYLRDLLDAEPRIERVPMRVTDLEPTNDRVRVVPDGRLFDRVILALGNAPPDDPCPVDESDGALWYARDPWAAPVRDAMRRAQSILFVGTGLTMVDLYLELEATGCAGTAIAVSRRGLLPSAHRPPQGPPDHSLVPDISTWPRTARGLLRRIRQSSRSGPDWREAINRLRSLTPQLWRELPIEERRRFLRRLRPYWDAHRHRMAPAVARRMDEALAAGRLIVRRAAVERIGPAGNGGAKVRFVAGGTRQDERFDLVVNCSGPACDPLIAHPLLQRLGERGLLRADSLRLGLDATPEGVVLDREGQPSRWLTTIGPLMRGVLWESTAVPEIRVHADALARSLVAALSGKATSSR